MLWDRFYGHITSPAKSQECQSKQNMTTIKDEVHSENDGKKENP